MEKMNLWENFYGNDRGNKIKYFMQLIIFCNIWYNMKQSNMEWNIELN
jgi:hypothetical protein